MSAGDIHWMRRCLQLAEQAAGRTAPNPMVGAVVVDRRGEVVGEGYHERAGLPHAEAIALDQAGARARGATLYVNLEPCRHRGNRRTHPCAPVVYDAGISRLVIGMEDPIAGHGGGATWLEQRGLEVVRDVLGAECRELNRPFIKWAQEGRPYFLLKAAATLDGRIATFTGESKWITGQAARADGHRLRNVLDAIVVGVGTAIADDPALTARGIEGGRDPVRIVLDRNLRLGSDAKLLPANSSSEARVILAASDRAPLSRERALVAAGAEIWRLGDEAVDLPRLAKRLGDEGFLGVLVEGGPRVHAAFVASGLADELRLYMAPKALGGAGPSAGPGWLGGEGAGSLAGAWELEFTGKPELVGRDVVMRLRPRRR